jgi:hypothetical protein
MPTTRNAQITIRARDVGEHFGTQGLVYRSGRIIHRTSPPRPYGFQGRRHHRREGLGHCTRIR